MLLQYYYNMNFLYIHGYGSNGNAHKAQLLKQMFPNHSVISPTIDYNHQYPTEIQDSLKQIVSKHNIDLIVGSSLGGYHALCTTQWYKNIVWCINPVRDVTDTIHRVLLKGNPATGSDLNLVEAYVQFDKQVFRQLPPRAGQLHFALSIDDELLGDHTPLLTQFPHYAHVVWEKESGHQFLKFDSLKNHIIQSIQNL